MAIDTVTQSTVTLYNAKLTATPMMTIIEHPTPADELLTARAAQLRSLLTLTAGACAEGFHLMHEREKDNILWLASDLADEIEMLATVMANGGSAKAV